MTTLKDTKLGDRVKVWLNQSCRLSKTKTNFPTIEATVIGKGVSEYDEPGDEDADIEYALGWKGDQMAPHRNDMTVRVPDELANYDLVPNRLDYVYYSYGDDADMECEILPPIQTQPVDPTTPKQTTTITRWVETTLKEAKLGDRVKIYAKKNGTPSFTKTNNTFEATIIGLVAKNTDRTFPVRIGWKKGETAPTYAAHGGKTSAFRHLLPNQHIDYVKHCGADYDDECQILRTIEVPVEFQRKDAAPAVGVITPTGAVQVEASSEVSDAPQILIVGDNQTIIVGYKGTATAGHNGTATAGNYGTATAGNSGTATAGNYGTATAGHYGTATAGDGGTATAGNGGTATAGYGGTATAGYYGTATAGYRGIATAGHHGTATAGYGGTATAGENGEIRIRYWDGNRYRTVCGCIGENGLSAGGAKPLEPNVKYRLDNDHKFQRVDAAPTTGVITLTEIAIPTEIVQVAESLEVKETSSPWTMVALGGAAMAAGMIGAACKSASVQTRVSDVVSLTEVVETATETATA